MLATNSILTNAHLFQNAESAILPLFTFVAGALKLNDLRQIGYKEVMLLNYIL